MNHEKFRARALMAIFLTVFLDLVGFGMFIPVLVNIARDFGADEAQASSLNTWYSIGTLASVLFLGRLSDRYGRKKLLLGTIGLSAVAHLCTGFAPDFLTLIVVRFLAGAASGNISVAQACISDVTSLKKRARSMVVIGLAFGGGFAIGPALGAVVSRFAGDHFMAAIGLTAFVLNVFNLLFVAVFFKESHPKMSDSRVQALRQWDREAEEGGAGSLPLTSQAALAPEFSPGQNIFRDFFQLMKMPALRVTFLMQFLQIFGFVGVETVLPLVLKSEYGFSTIQIYDSFVVLGVSVLFINGVVARKVLSHVDERIGVKIGQFALCLGIAGLHLCVPGQTGLYTSLILIATGTSFTNPAVSSLTSKLCPPEKMGLSFGALQAVASIARILGPLFMGYFYQVLDGSRSLWVTVGIIAGASVFSFWIPKQQSKEN